MKQKIQIKLLKMKKTIITASLLLAIPFFSKAQSLASVNTGNNKVCNGTKTCEPNSQLNTAKDGLHEFSGNKMISDYDYYMKKSSNKNTVAWIMVSGGAVCTGIGILTFPKDYDVVFENSKSTDGKAEFSSTLTIIGIAAMICSIPFFISSSIDRHKAHISISNQKTGFGIPLKYGKELTGVTLSIPIGK